MTRLTCIAIDDEPLALEVIKTHVSQIPDLDLIDTFPNPVEATALLQSQQIDLIFLDIEMPLVSGIDFLKSLRNPPQVIFTTAYRHYAIESYELDVVDYLLKPISFPRFFKAVTKLKNQVTGTGAMAPRQEPALVHDHIYVNANKKFIKIRFQDIQYVESVKDYVRIHTAEQRIMTKESLSQFEQKLPKGFLRIHRSFIVNLSYVTAFTKVDVEIGTTEIPIGASYKEAVMQVLKKE
ncbi:MAG: LytTR family DNA-binding domain-containing protein [Flavobacteriaceae bacterium]|nr:LytTR family DNA-binding domain-containing protein [Flavobacteriaceae bacterium]